MLVFCCCCLILTPEPIQGPKNDRQLLCYRIFFRLPRPGGISGLLWFSFIFSLKSNALDHSATAPPFVSQSLPSNCGLRASLTFCRFLSSVVGVDTKQSTPTRRRRRRRCNDDVGNFFQVLIFFLPVSGGGEKSRKKFCSFDFFLNLLKKSFIFRADYKRNG